MHVLQLIVVCCENGLQKFLSFTALVRSCKDRFVASLIESIHRRALSTVTHAKYVPLSLVISDFYYSGNYFLCNKGDLRYILVTIDIWWNQCRKILSSELPAATVIEKVGNQTR